MRNSNMRQGKSTASVAALVTNGQFSQAIALAQKLLRKDQKNAELHNLIGIAYLHNLDTIRGEKHLKRASRLVPGWSEPLYSLGYFYKEQRQPQRALETFQQAFSCDRTEVARSRFGSAVLSLNKPWKVLQVFREESRGPLNFNDWMVLSNALADTWQWDEAIEASRNAVKLHPKDAGALSQLALRLNEAGNLSEAREVYEKALRINPSLSSTHYRLALLTKFKERNAQMRSIENLIAANPKNPSIIAGGSFALAKAFDDLGETDKAFDFFEKGNRAARSQFAYDLEVDADFFRKVREVFSSSISFEPENIGPEAKKPVFILGMPRSGTTMAEQILGAHPDVFAAGEIDYLGTAVTETAEQFSHARPFPDSAATFSNEAWSKIRTEYLESVPCREPYFTNKLPANYLYIGVILTAIPEAKIVHCRRNPLDTCLSIFQQYFANSAIRYGSDQSELAAYFQLYNNLMAHWEHLYADRIYSFNYEEVVRDPRSCVSGLLNYCGLPWDDACLLFHQQKTAIRTASQVQARQGINAGSVGRWQKYERHLGPLIKGLGDLVKG